MPDTLGDSGATVVKTAMRLAGAQSTRDPIFDVGTGRQLACTMGLGKAKR